MILAAFVWTVSAGSVIAMVVSVVAVAAGGYGLWVKVRGGGPWRSVAEGEQEKNKLLEDQNRLLKAENEALDKKTNVQGVMQLVGQVAGSVAAMAKHVNDLGVSLKEHRGDLDEHRSDYSTVSAAMTVTLQSFGVILDDMRKEMQTHNEQALERHEAIMAELRRPPTARTRRDDLT